MRLTTSVPLFESYLRFVQIRLFGQFCQMNDEITLCHYMMLLYDTNYMKQPRDPTTVII